MFSFQCPWSPKSQSREVFALLSEIIVGFFGDSGSVFSIAGVFGQEWFFGSVQPIGQKWYFSSVFSVPGVSEVVSGVAQQVVAGVAQQVAAGVSEVVAGVSEVFC